MSSAGESVKVVCRFRPQNKLEIKKGGRVVVDFESDQRLVHGGEHDFNFDEVFPPDTSQADLYGRVGSSVVENVLTGYNATVFAYGQTSSGKTHTMMGPILDDPEMMGLIPRMVEDVFAQVDAGAATTEYTVRVSYFEIYLERLRDLLNPTQVKLAIRENKARGIFVQGLTDVIVNNAKEVFEVMARGSENRKVSSTNMNAVSSRSHSIFQMTIEGRNLVDFSSTTGKLNLVDLAGSEKVGKTGAVGERLDEAKNINTSLTALGKVIYALTDGSRHIPYRDSKLTRVLQESLGGNARTLLIINCSPSSFNQAETLSTLRFGRRAKNIKNTATVNQKRSPAEMELLIVELEKQLAQLKSYVASLEAQLAAKDRALAEAGINPASVVVPVAGPEGASAAADEGTGTGAGVGAAAGGADGAVPGADHGSLSVFAERIEELEATLKATEEENAVMNLRNNELLARAEALEEELVVERKSKAEMKKKWRKVKGQLKQHVMLLSKKLKASKAEREQLRRSYQEAVETLHTLSNAMTGATEFSGDADTLEALAVANRTTSDVPEMAASEMSISMDVVDDDELGLAGTPERVGTPTPGADDSPLPGTPRTPRSGEANDVDVDVDADADEPSGVSDEPIGRPRASSSGFSPLHDHREMISRVTAGISSMQRQRMELTVATDTLESRHKTLAESEAKMQATIGVLETEHARLQEQMARAAEQLASLDDDRSDLTSIIASLRNDKAELTAAVSAAAAEGEHLRQDIHELELARAAAQNEMAVLSKEVDYLVRDRDQARSELAELADERATLTAALGSLREDHAQVQADHAATLATLEAARGTLESSQASARAAQEALRETEAQADKAQAQVAAMESKKARLAATIDSYSLQDHELSTHIADMTRKRDKLEKEAQTLRVTLEGLGREKESLTADVVAQREAAAAVAAEAARAQQELVRVTTEREGVARALAAAKEQIAGLEDKIEKKRDQQEDLQAQVAASKGTIAVLRENKQTLAEEKEALMQSVSKLERQQAERMAELTSASNAVVKQTEEQQRALAACQQQLEDTQGQLEAARGSLAQATADADATASRLEDTRRALAEAEAAHTTRLAEIQEAETAADAARASVADLEQRTDDLCSQREAAQDDLERLTEARTQAESCNATLERRKQELEEQIASLEAEMAGKAQQKNSLVKNVEDSLVESKMQLAQFKFERDEAIIDRNNIERRYLKLQDKYNKLLQELG